MARTELTPDDWTVELERGLEYRRKYGVEDKWPSLEALYFNTHNSAANSGPNVIMSTGDALLSTLVVPSAYISVDPTRPEATDNAKVVETLDNQLLKDMQIPMEMQRASLNCYLMGRGIFKHGYDSEWGWNPRMDVAGRMQLGATITQRDKKGNLIEYRSDVKPGMPWTRAVDPRDFIVPWGTLEIADAPWVAHRVVRHIDDVRKDPKYSGARGLEPNLTMEDFVQSYVSLQKIRRIQESPRITSSGGDPEFVEIYEIHDKRTGKVKALVPGHDKFLRNDENALQIDGKLPFTSFSFLPPTRTFWVTPDAYYIWHAQLELSDISIQATKQRRLSTLKFLAQESAISEEERTKMLSQEVGAFVKIKDGFDPNTVVATLQAGQNISLYQVDEEAIRSNTREQIGFSRNQFGEFSGGRKTAREAVIVDRSSALRMSRRELRVKEAYEGIFEKTNNIVFKYWRTPRVVQVLGRDGARKWQQFVGPQLSGTYRYDVTLSDEEGLADRRGQALNLYAAMLQNPNVDKAELHKLLINAFNDPKFSKVFDIPEGQEGLQGQQQMMQQGQSEPRQLGGQQ